MSPAHLSVIGGAFILESVVQYTVLVRYLEFGGYVPFKSRKCIASMDIAVGTFTVVCYMDEVCYWEGPLSEVPLYIARYASGTGCKPNIVYKRST